MLFNLLYGADTFYLLTFSSNSVCEFMEKKTGQLVMDVGQKMSLLMHCGTNMVRSLL